MKHDVSLTRRQWALLAAPVLALGVLGLWLPSRLLQALTVIAALAVAVRATRLPPSPWSRLRNARAEETQHRAPTRAEPQPPRFAFREDAATEAAAWFLEKAGGHLLYMADRLALTRHGSPITHDDLCSAPHGVVGRRLWALLSEGPGWKDSALWSRCITGPTGDRTIHLAATPETGQLSAVQDAVLRAVFRAHGAEDLRQIRADAVSLPEWRHPGPDALRPVDLREIFAEAGWTDLDITEVFEELEYLFEVHRDLR